MDNSVPPTNQRAATRSVGGSVPPSNHPVDPRLEAPSGNGQRKRAGGNGSKWMAARGALGLSKRAAPVDVPEVPALESEARAPETDDATVEAPVIGLQTAEAFVLPPIVPAEAPPSPTEVVPLVPLVVEPSSATAFTDTDGTDGLPSLTRPKKAPRALRQPVTLSRRRPRVRRVTRVVRHVDPWSVFKVALVFNLFFFAVCLTSGVLLWQVAQNTGTVDNMEKFFENFGWSSFDLKGGQIYHNAWIAGLFLAIGFTGLAVLMATLFNLITDLVGGIRVSVLEEEVVAREDRGLSWRKSRRASKVLVSSSAEPAPLSVPVPHPD